MRALLPTLVAVSLAAGTLSVASAAAEKKVHPQQERMKACTAQAGDKKGDERKAAMSLCLKGGAARPMSQQDKQDKLKSEQLGRRLILGIMVAASWRSAGRQ